MNTHLTVEKSYKRNCSDIYIRLKSLYGFYDVGSNLVSIGLYDGSTLEDLDAQECHLLAKFLLDKSIKIKLK